MSRYNMNVLADAKEEYTRQLISVISPEIYVGIKSIYDAAQSHCSKIKDKNVLKKFQVLLSSVPQWNQSKVEAEFERIVKKTDCDFIEDLITAVFVSHTRILTSINFNKNKNKINLKIPKVDHFMHLCYIEVARNVWKNPYLFDDNVTNLPSSCSNDSLLLSCFFTFVSLCLELPPPPFKDIIINIIISIFGIIIITIMI